MVLDAVLNVLTGGATGLLGSIVSRVGGIFEEKSKRATLKMQYEHEKEMQAMNLETLKLQGQQQIELAELRTSGEMRTASYAQDASYGVAYRWIVSILRMVRPVLTFSLVGASVYLIQRMSDPVVEHSAILQIISLTAMAIGWWFGDRGVSK